MPKGFRVYQGYGAVDLTQEEWQRILAHNANMLTDFLNHAGGYTFPLDGTFGVDRAEALLGVVWHEYSKLDPNDFMIDVGQGEPVVDEMKMLATALGVFDPDLSAAMESVTGANMEQAQAWVSEIEDSSPESLPVPPGRGEGWSAPNPMVVTDPETGEMTEVRYHAEPPESNWWKYGLAGVGGAVVGGLGIFLATR